MFNLRLFSLLLVLVFAVQATKTNLRGLQPAQGECPPDMPTGLKCSSMGLQCGYEHIQVPRMAGGLTKDVCTGVFDCVPAAMCACLGDKWQCLQSALAPLQCKNGVPKGTHAPCEPK